MELTPAARRDRAAAARAELAETLEARRNRLADLTANARPGDAGAVARIARATREVNSLTARIDALDRDIALLDVTDDDKAAARLADALNAAASARDLAAAVQDAAGERFKLSARETEAILALRDRLPRRRFSAGTLARLETIRPGLLDDLLAALGSSVTVRLRPQIATLLPVRLETRFDPPGAGRPNWRLRLRIVPDRPWFSSHDPLPSAGELNDVEQFWRDLDGGTPTSALGREAFARLADSHGAPRALWLVRSFPVTGADANGDPVVTRPANLKEPITGNRIVDFPNEVQVWAERGGALQQLAVLPINANGLSLDFGDPDDPAAAGWWEDFEIAKRVGLGAEIDLATPPADIDALYVTGLGPHAPSRIFAEQRDAGSLSVLPRGVPTNTVDGAPAGADESGPRWLELLGVAASTQDGVRALAQALTGDAGAIGPVPGGALAPSGAARDVLGAIWPAAWGHTLGDIFGGGEGIDRLGLWAAQAAAPQGHLPALRIGRAVYGVLPVTALDRWTKAAGDPEIETEIAPGLLRSMDVLARQAEGAGTALAAPTERLFDIVSQPAVSTGIAARQMVEGQILQMLAWRVGEGIGSEELRRLYEDGAAGLQEAGVYREPVRRLFAVGPPLDITAPLVTPDNRPDLPTFGDLVKRLLLFDDALIASESGLREVFGNERPRSLLFELVLRSLRLTAARARLASTLKQTELLEPLFRDAVERGRIEALARQLAPGDLALSNPQTLLYRVVRDAIRRLIDHPDAELELALRSCIDCTSHRIDPFVTGFAARRLQVAAGLNPVRRLGAYGWVDRPFLGDPGPVPETLLLAPSAAQAATAALLRDRSLSDFEPARWQMDVSSAGVRRAALLRDEVRAGVHLSEAMGRMVEDAVGAPAAIAALRGAFPQRADAVGRSTCDGLAVLRAAPAALPLSAAQHALLVPWREALDVYGDLLVAEGVHHAANGRPGRAQAAMEAATGLSVPPELDLLATPREAAEALTTVLFALPRVAPPAAPAAFTHPVGIAEPSFVAWIEAEFGAADAAGWTWQVTPDAGGAATNVTLDAMGLAVADVLTTGAGSLAARAAAAAGIAGRVAGGAGPENHARVRRLAATVAKDPAARSDFYGMPDDDASTRAELAQRFALLRAAGEALLAELQAQAGPGGTAAGRAGALAAAEAWGIRPLPQAIAGQSAADRCADAGQVLGTRLGAAPQAADAGALDLRRIAERIATLATVDGHIPVLSVVPTPPAPNPLPVQAAPAGTAGLTAFEEDWLSVVAAVREPLARLELAQLDALVAGDAPLSVWTDRPNDPWQLAVPRSPDGRRQPSRMRVVFGPAATLDGLAPDTPLAMGLVDAWAERIPETEQTAGMAFNFNAPSARAQNAILAVAPPDLEAPLNPRTLVDCLRHARTLTRARMVAADNVGPFVAALSLALLPAGSGMTDRLTGGRGGN